MENLRDLAAKDAVKKRLYANANGTCDFSKPTAPTGFVKLLYKRPLKSQYPTAQPIEATYGEGSRWRPWQVEDQRFVSSRPDVASFTAATLTSDLTVTGSIVAHLFAKHIRQ